MSNWYDNPITNGFSTVAIPGNWDTPHYGVDIGLPMHTPITDLLAGTVVKSDYAPWGGEVFVKLANGLQEYFYHLDQLDVSVGQTVTPGQLIGLSGGQNSGGQHNVSTLYSSGPHLHFGITNGKVVAGPSGQQYLGVDPTSIITEARNGMLGIGTGGVTSTNAPTGLTFTDPTGTTKFIDAANTSAQALSDIGNFTISVGDFLNTFDYKDFAIRASLIIVGLIIVILGIYMFASN